MVKFSKQFEAQLVPEWKDAFVNYRQLKKDVKKIQKQRRLQAAESADRPAPGPFKFDRLSRITEFIRKKTRHCLRGDVEPNIIQVHRPREDVYETKVLQGQFDQTDAAQSFFSTLDAQLNKVNQFYKTKEKEFLERGNALKEQLRILKDLKAALKQQKAKQSSHGAESENNSTHSVASPDESKADGIREPVEDDDLGDMQDTAQLEEEGMIGFENNGPRLVESPKRRSFDGTKSKKNNEKHLSKIKSNPRSRSFSSHGRSMRMDIPITTPSRTISAVTYLWEDLMSQQNRETPERNRFILNKKTLHQAEKLIRGALVELYRGLGFLKTYRTLNMLAFEKILKKFDKVTGQQQVLPIYLNVVERSYFNSSDKVVKLADEIEELFTQHYAADDRRKAMTYLKPKQSKDSHTVTFFIGLFTGCFLALFVGYFIMAHLAKSYNLGTNTTYLMATSYQVFSLLNLHIFLYGCNIVMWRRHRINYIFIFEFARKRELKYQDVFLICTTFMTIVAGCMVAQLALTEKGFSSVHVDTIPGLLLLASMAILLCPLNIIYRSTRFTFLRVLRNIVLSPFYKVVMVDFFMADQLTSQVPLLRQLEYVTCYYATGSFRTKNPDICTNNQNYRDLAYVISFLPYYWRAMECARRWFDEGDVNNLTNLGKYVSAMVAAGARLTYEKQPTIGWLALVVITSTIATIYQLYWDFVKDWGLLKPRSRNPWLRDELILKHKIIYFLSMALNLVLRLAWLQTVLHSSLVAVDKEVDKEVEKEVASFFLAALEVIRRGHWNFYRLENEHLNNAGHYRAIKPVPLPFHEVDDD